MINDSICFLVGYALKNGLIEESDKVLFCKPSA